MPTDFLSDPNSISQVHIELVILNHDRSSKTNSEKHAYTRVNLHIVSLLARNGNRGGIEFSENHLTTNFSKKQRRRMGARLRTKTSTRHIVRARAARESTCFEFRPIEFCATCALLYRPLPSLNLIYQRAKQLPFLFLRTFFFFLSPFFLFPNRSWNLSYTGYACAR